jgi:hypothetical protein
VVPGCPAFARHPVWLNRSVIAAANVDPSVIRQHVTVVIVPVVGASNSRDKAKDVPPMNTAVTDPGETVIAADAVPHKGGRAGHHGPATDCQLRHGSETAGLQRHGSQTRCRWAFRARSITTYPLSREDYQIRRYCEVPKFRRQSVVTRLPNVFEVAGTSPATARDK